MPSQTLIQDVFRACRKLFDLESNWLKLANVVLRGRTDVIVGQSELLIPVGKTQSERVRWLVDRLRPIQEQHAVADSVFKQAWVTFSSAAPQPVQIDGQFVTSYHGASILLASRILSSIADAAATPPASANSDQAPRILLAPLLQLGSGHDWPAAQVSQIANAVDLAPEELLKQIEPLMKHVKEVDAGLIKEHAFLVSQFQANIASADVAPSDGDLEATIPPLDNSGNWITAKRAKDLDGIDLRSLKNYRSMKYKSHPAKYVAKNKMSGIDADGRTWRRRPHSTDKSHPLYYAPSLVCNRARTN